MKNLSKKTLAQWYQWVLLCQAVFWWKSTSATGNQTSLHSEVICESQAQACGLHAVSNKTHHQKDGKRKEAANDMGHVLNSTGEWKYLCEKPAGPFPLLKLQSQTVQLALQQLQTVIYNAQKT